MRIDEVLWTLAEEQHGVVGRRQLWERGIQSNELLHRMRTGRLVALSAEVLRLAGAPITEGGLAMAGVLDSPGGAYLSHTSAAAWWGLPGFHLERPVHTVIPWQGTTSRTRLTVVHYHRALPQDHLRTLNGVPVVSPALAIFLLAAVVSPGRTERALDNAWSLGLVTHLELHQLFARLAARGRNGIRVMRRVLADRPADYVAPQSGLEARVERLARDVGVTLLRQVDSGGNAWIGRVDFRILGSRKLIEVLSQRYHSSVGDRRNDEKRFHRLREAGFEVLVLWDSEIWSDGSTVSEHILLFSRGDVAPRRDISAPKRSTNGGQAEATSTSVSK